MAIDAAAIAQDLLRIGYARVSLDPTSREALHHALTECRAFFSEPSAVKAQHSSGDLNFGYRPLGHEYSITPDRPDLNECFTLWSDRLDLIPAADQLTYLTHALLTWRGVLVDLVSSVLNMVAESFAALDVPAFAAASYLQINNYPKPTSDRDLLQDRHEDGHLLTVIHTTRPGLEILPVGGEQPMPVTTSTDEVLIMPGGVMTDLTDGKIPPLDHQVRNHGLADRMAIMYFVNPELTSRLVPWTGDTSVDLRDKVRTRPAAFGLPDVPVL